MMLTLAIRDLEMWFPGLAAPALSISSLQLEAGARVALTGASGSGKSTLINVITGMVGPTRGRVSWNDADLVAMREGARDRWRAENVGLVMQDFHLFPGLSAISNVLLPQRLARRTGLADLRTDAEGILKRVGITNPAQAIETMSRGQMQRVAVARAILGRPGLIVADEPTASLDAEAGVAVMDLLLELSAEANATLIVATHDEKLMAGLGRVIRLENGSPVS